MLSYDPGFLVGYAPLGTVASLVIAVVFTGIGIAAMHYTGMSAMVVGGQVVWNFGIVAGSVIVGAVVATGAFAVGARSGRRRTRVLATALLTLAICISRRWARSIWARVFSREYGRRVQ